MKTKIESFFVKSLSIALTICLTILVCNDVNAATRAATRTTPSTRKTVSTAPRQSTTTTTVATTVESSEPEMPVAEPEPEPEQIIIENKTGQFNTVLSESGTSARDESAEDFRNTIQKQRAAFLANEDAEFAQQEQKNAQNTGKNACDTKLRECMGATCGKDFTKCATDGDTAFGDKLNKCRRDTTCTSEEFRLFTTEIKADRDLNVKMSSYNSVLECGNTYNKCIEGECGATFNKCLGKAAADKAIQKCATIAKNCTEQDSGLASRMGTVIGRLREKAEEDVKTDEKQLYSLRDLMRKQCEHLGAMFDERSFDCVYTINFFAGTNQSSPLASRKGYAGDTFICTQEWFGINATTFKENAYRETRSQTAASSAMLGAGLGTAAGLITSGAIDRALETQKAKKALKEECESQGGKLNNKNECVSDDEDNKETDTKEDVSAKDKNTAIKAFNARITIGKKIIVPDALMSDSEVNKAFDKWYDRCEAYTDGNGATSGSVEGESDTDGFHCEIATCDEKSYTLTNGKCIENDKKESKTQPKTQNNNNNKTSKKIAEIDKVLNSSDPTGTEIQFSSDQWADSNIQDKVGEYEQKCNNFSDSKTKKAVYVSGGKNGKRFIKCKAQECADDTMIISEKGQCKKETWIDRL